MSRPHIACAIKGDNSAIRIKIEKFPVISLLNRENHQRLVRLRLRPPPPYGLGWQATFVDCRAKALRRRRVVRSSVRSAGGRRQVREKSVHMARMAKPVSKARQSRIAVSAKRVPVAGGETQGAWKMIAGAPGAFGENSSVSIDDWW